MSEKKPVVLVEELADMLCTSRSTIYKRLKAGTFPIPDIKGIDDKKRWSRVVVEEWVARNGYVGTKRGKAAA